jgi:hypothetical protein
MRRTLLISAALAAVIALGFVGCQSAGIQSGNDNGSPIIITDVAPYPIDNRLPAGDYSVELRHENAFRGNRPSYVEKSTVFGTKTHQIVSLEIASKPGEQIPITAECAYLYSTEVLDGI